jgi:hypothetical protein
MLTFAFLLLAAGVASQPGVTVAAAATVKTAPATYDLAGFRLGMSEDQVQQTINARGMTVRANTRVVDFETKVRNALNADHHGSFRETGRSVLEDATLDDGQGGQIVLHLLGWPDGAHVSSITYLIPHGTPPAAWGSLLAQKYGAPGETTSSATTFRATWCGKTKDCFNTADAFRLQAAVGAGGGTIVLTQPESVPGRVPEAVEAEAARRSTTGRPKL